MWVDVAALVIVNIVTQESNVQHISSPQRPVDDSLDDSLDPSCACSKTLQGHLVIILRLRICKRRCWAISGYRSNMVLLNNPMLGLNSKFIQLVIFCVQQDVLHSSLPRY
jgi:hypothetical protein